MTKSSSKAVAAADRPSGAAPFAPGRPVAEAALQHVVELVHVERLDQVVVGPLADRRDRALHPLVRGDHDHVGARVHRVDLLEEVDAAHARHLEVGDHHVGTELVDVRERLLGALRAEDLEPRAEQVELEGDPTCGSSSTTMIFRPMPFLPPCRRTVWSRIRVRPP
jgi:hypothetical protein